jgi:hypothetical protein
MTLEFWCVVLFLALSGSMIALIAGLDLLLEEKP